LARFFAAVFGADQAERRKPAPAMLQAASAALGVPLAQLLMVGDSPLDLLAAERAGCPAAWVAWGYGGEQRNAGTAAWRITEPHHLLHALKDGRRLPAAID
ncbi:MAG: HAD-IA family hydrolase, partial [Caldimonas sp.]